MYIKSLHLHNFQKHKDLQIDFVNGVNVLYGKSDAGKSCIRRAIEWVVQNESIDGVRKTGTKKTSVKIILDNNKEIERVRSQSINRYIIREGKDEQVFDAIGKSIPDEVEEVLSIHPIEIDNETLYLNSHAQIALPFLFDKSPSFRMKLFNKLTGNDVLDKLFGQFNKDILRIKRNLKEETKRFEDREIQLKSCKTKMEKAEAIHSRLKKRIDNLRKLYDKYANLLELKQLQFANKEYIEEVNKKLKNLDFPLPQVMQRLTEKIDRFEQLLTQKKGLEKANFGINRVEGQLNDLKPTQLNLATLEGKIQRFDRIKAIYEKKSHIQVEFDKITENLKQLQKDQDISEHKHKRLLSEIKICPTCNQEIKT